MPVTRFRIAAYVAAALSIVGAARIAAGTDFDVAIWWILVPHALFGALLALPFYPLTITRDRLTLNQQTSWRRVAVDFGILAGIEAVLLLVVFVVAAIADSGADASNFLLVLFGPLLVVGLAGGLGLMAGLLVLLPLASLGVTAWRAATGGRVDVVIVASAVLLLAVVGSAITGVLAIGPHDVGSGSRARGAVDMFAVTTGIPLRGVSVESQPLAWVSRLCTVIVIAAAIVLFRVGAHRRRTRRTRRRD